MNEQNRTIRNVWIIILASLAIGAGPARGAEYYRNARHGIDLSLGGTFSPWSTDYGYDYDWNYSSLNQVREDGRIELTGEAGGAFGMGYTYYLNRLVGLGGRIDYQAASIHSETDYDLLWRWNDGRSYNLSDTDESDGDLLQTALSFTTSLRLGGRRVVPSFRFGLTFYQTDVDVEAGLGWADSTISGSTQYIDYFWLDARLDDSIQTFGGHVVFQLDIALSRVVALRLHTGYYFSSTDEITWEIQSGAYDGQLNTLDATYSDASARAISEGLEDNFGSVEVDPSMVVAGFGVVIGL